MSPVRGDGDGHPVSRNFRTFVLWWLSWQFAMPLLRVRAAAAKIQAQKRGITDRSPLIFWPLNSVSVGAEQTYSIPGCVSHTGVPALTSTAGASLYFVFPIPQVASPQPPCRGSRSSQSQSAVSSVRDCGPSAPPCRRLQIPGALTGQHTPTSL